MHRFFLTGMPIVPNQPVDLSPLAHQLSTVLRLRAGDEITLLDGSGAAFRTEIRQLERRAAVGWVVEKVELHSETSVPVTLCACVLKGSNFEWVLQKGTEIGVARFVPVISSRTIVRPADKIRNKYERWLSIIREAAEQSGRARLPELADPLTWDELIAQTGGVRLLPWEERANAARRIPATLAAHPHPSAITLAIGPEGGLSAAEVAQASAAGWHTVSLGPRILPRRDCRTCGRCVDHSPSGNDTHRGWRLDWRQCHGSLYRCVAP